MTKTKAEKEAKWLQGRLGNGWEIRVWENIGWHYSCEKYNISVHSAHLGQTLFHALVSDTASTPGTGAGIWSCSSGLWYSDPRDAVRSAVEQVNKTMAGLVAAQYDAQRCVDDFE